MRKYSTNLGFVDLLFNLLVGFCSLLLIAFLLINPIADEGKIDPRSEFLIVATWPDNSVMDIDLWVKGPDGSVVSFKNKDGNSGCKLLKLKTFNVIKQDNVIYLNT